MTSAIAKVTSAEARHVPSAETTDVASAETAHMASATHMATATSVSSATAAAAGLCTSGKKAAGKHCTCQNHHHSSSHDILLWNGREFPPQSLVRRRRIRGRQTPASRWTEDGDTYLSPLLNSRSIFLIEAGAARTKGKPAPDQQLETKRRGLRMLFQSRNLDR